MQLKRSDNLKIVCFDGIVLTDVNYGESSKIINVLSDKYGMIGVISKGCRNMKSKLRGVTHKLVYGTFNVYYKENGLSTLISVDIKNSFSKIMNDLEKISFATYLLDLTYQVIKQSDSKEIYELLKNTLIKIEDGFNPLILSNILELKYLDYLGVHPNIDNCCQCGSDKNIVTLSANEGGYICKNCFTNQGYVLSQTIKTIRMYYYVDIKKIIKLDIEENVIKEINRFLDEYYDKYTGIYLKSKDFLNKINQRV